MNYKGLRIKWLKKTNLMALAFALVNGSIPGLKKCGLGLIVITITVITNKILNFIFSNDLD